MFYFMRLTLTNESPNQSDKNARFLLQEEGIVHEYLLSQPLFSDRQAFDEWSERESKAQRDP